MACGVVLWWGWAGDGSEDDGRKRSPHFGHLMDRPAALFGARTLAPQDEQAKESGMDSTPIVLKGSVFSDDGNAQPAACQAKRRAGPGQTKADRIKASRLLSEAADDG